jgi:hypothetical protein
MLQNMWNQHLSLGPYRASSTTREPRGRVLRQNFILLLVGGDEAACSERQADEVTLSSSRGNRHVLKFEIRRSRRRRLVTAEAHPTCASAWLQKSQESYFT